jgi:hypothetical protein
MLILDLFEELQGPPEPTLIDALRDFLPLAINHLELKELPKIKLLGDVETDHMPSFGKFSNDDRTVHLGIKNRHPNDILRTLAHEMVHYAQGEHGQLEADSGATGSPEEDQANAEAGVIMREFNQQFPQYMELKPIMLEKWSKKYKKSINCSNPKGFSQKAHCAGRKKNTNVAETTHQHTEIIKHQVGPWTVYIGDHAWARAMTRNIGPRMMSNLISSLVLIPNLDKQVPVGGDFWIKDNKTNSSFYFKRLNIPGEPLAVRCETGIKDEPRAGRRTPVFNVNAYTGPEKPEHVKSMRYAKYVKQFVGVNPLAKDISTAAKQDKLVPGNPAVITNPETQDSRRYDRAFQQAKKKDMAENFADGKGPGRPGDSQRHGIPKGATMAQLEKAAKASGRKGQLARWQINMRRGKKK